MKFIRSSLIVGSFALSLAACGGEASDGAEEEEEGTGNPIGPMAPGEE